MSKSENDDKPQVDLELNLCECAMLNGFKLYTVHAESAEIEIGPFSIPKWMMLNIIGKNCH